MSEMVERVAWSLYEKHCTIKGTKVPRESIPEEDKSEYIDLAISAFLALRDLPENPGSGYSAGEYSRRNIEAMIEDALK